MNIINVDKVKNNSGDLYAYGIESKTELILSDSHGVYIPQLFCQDNDKIKEAYPFDSWVLLHGPYVSSEDLPENSETFTYFNEKTNDSDSFTVEEIRDLYWECWDNILRNTVYITDNHESWYLYQSGDLWAYNSNMTEREEEEFFGHL